MTTPSQVSQQLSTFFATHLPVTQFMQMDVEGYDGQTLILHAPLAPNINDKQTAFGGSLYNASVMACWGMAHLKTLEAKITCNQVITKANIEYLSPVHGDIRAICHVPNEEVVTKFIEQFKHKGRARITLHATIEYSGKVAVKFEGTYAILKE
ncbi:thioesterase domain-containing protein [Oceaniserpentilla sp. 4NH20-0058]|uniref:thioesterase domain-containing protein n=1 Tax=Oceaniserpentilla sp. 4NH20-0058 TaxID=3127660 RepID=UPI003108C4D4